ncbi:MAG: hypothetical protein J6X85_00580 [Ruminococcus sp.]|nr:hypothetical protein [Ruminococcus sp.]
MRESTMWATQGGPIIGEIKNGKKYPFGTVPATEYDADMQALRTEIAGLNTAVVSCEGTLSGLQTALDTLAGQYAATVPGLSQSVADIRVDITGVISSITTLTETLGAAIGDVDTKVDNLDSSYNTRFDTLGNRIDALAAKEAGDVETLTGRLDTAASDIRSTQITVRDHTTSINSLTAATGQLRTDVDALRTSVQGHTTAIENLETAAGALSSDLGAVTDLAAGTAATVAGNSEAITGIRDAITQMRASITANADAINAFNAAITELTSTQNVDRATLTARIAAAENSVTALAQTVEGYNTGLSNQIAALRASVTASAQDIAVIQNTLQIQGAAVESVENRCTAVENRMNTQEVGMATLRQQLLNSVMNIENEIEQIVTDKAAIKADLTALTQAVNAYEADTDATLREYNTRIARLEDSTPLEIISFTATPDVCEVGGSENVVLSWNVQGNIESLTINGEPVSGSSKTYANVHEATSFTLNAVDAKGNIARRTISVDFVNHIFWGVSASANQTEGTVKALDNTELSNVRARTITVSANNEYIYYAYPKRLGTSEFRVNGFTGGFENPAIVSIDNHAGYDEDYYVYRSANKLNSTFDVHII